MTNGTQKAVVHLKLFFFIKLQIPAIRISQHNFCRDTELIVFMEGRDTESRFSMLLKPIRYKP